ncbi:MAG: flavin prenyltransferase UbiX [Mariprofundaceae bacterium]
MADTKPSGREMLIAITGASGAAYALRLIKRLGGMHLHLHVIVSDAGRQVLRHELGVKLPATPRAMAAALAGHLGASADGISCYGMSDWFSPAASGSSNIDSMVIIPCSMGSLARIAAGCADNLIERAADVMLKEARRLIIVPRETPLSALHLENMLKLARMGVRIIPAMPGFYHGPATIDDLVDSVVDRVLSHLDADDGMMQRWGRTKG